jgi:hypothetical protein
LGAAAQITEPHERLAVGNAFQPKVVAWFWPGQRLAERRRLPKRGDETLPALDAIRGAMAEIMD